MIQQYRCYFIDKDGTGRSLASIPAKDPLAAVEIATRRFPALASRSVEVWYNSDRVLMIDADQPLRRVS
jgi:hypothetical protein